MQLEPLGPGARGLLRILDVLPAPGGEWILVLGALAQGLLRPTRRRRALRWAASQPRRGRSGFRLACAVLAERGRFLAALTQVGVRAREGLRARLVVEGREHLDAIRGRSGAILVGFHLGLGATTPLALRLSGYRVVSAGRGRGFFWPRAPHQWIVPPPEDLIQWTDLVSRVTALRQIRQRLLAGGLVYLAADGEGHEAFRVPLPGRDMRVRAGWLALRRATVVPTLPVLGYRDGNRVVVRVYPSLPPPVPDADRDAAQCRAALVPVLEDFVRRFPAQCFMLALDHEDGATGPASRLHGPAMPGPA